MYDPNQTLEPVADFNSTDDALCWMVDKVDDPFIDNKRMAFEDNADEMAIFEKAEDNGCCGSFRELVTIKGRRMWIGCNYGH